MCLKNYIAVLLLFYLVACQTKQTTTDTLEPENEERTSTKFEIAQGVNISHWLSQNKTRRGQERADYFTREDVKFIKEIGYDHIRLPVDEEQLWNEQGEKEAEAFQLLHNALKWCQEEGLRVIVDLHILRSFHFNRKDNTLFTDPAEQEKFCNLWRELSAELSKYPNDQIAYELMNESVADDPNDWNKLVAKGVAAVRETEPERKILIGSNRWQSVDTFDQLIIPENDPNIILSFHFYIPMMLTHYTAPWVASGFYTGPVHYPGQTVRPEEMSADTLNMLQQHVDIQEVMNKELIQEKFQKPLAFAQKMNLQLYCGEWGCLPAAPAEDRMQWYQDVRSVLEENKIAWTNWDYKGGFGIRNDSTGTPYQELIDILLD